MLPQRLGRSLLCRRLVYAHPRWQSTVASATLQQEQDLNQHDGPPKTATNRAEVTMKRFWKNVGVEKHGSDYTVTLDKRALKTPSGSTLLIPNDKAVVAGLVAAEWEHQRIVLKPHALPMTSLASRAIDAMSDADTRTLICTQLLKYLDTDTVCFKADDPPPLVELQEKHWEPLLSWVRSELNVRIDVFDSILFTPQPQESKDKLGKILAKMDHWELAAMERATYASKSFLIGLALVKKQLTVEEAALAAHVEVNSQIERWGEVEDSHDVDFHDIRRQLGSAACLLTTV